MALEALRNEAGSLADKLEATLQRCAARARGPD